MIQNIKIMNRMSLTYARSNLDAVIDQLCEDDKPVVITRTDGPSVVLMSLADYNAIDETAYLLRSPANAARLRASLAHARSGEVCETDAISR